MSNVTQNQRDKCHMFSLIYGSKFKIFRCECITWLTLDTREYEETTEEEAVLGDKQQVVDDVFEAGKQNNGEGTQTREEGGIQYRMRVGTNNTRLFDKASRNYIYYTHIYAYIHMHTYT